MNVIGRMGFGYLSHVKSFLDFPRFDDLTKHRMSQRKQLRVLTVLKGLNIDLILREVFLTLEGIIV